MDAMKGFGRFMWRMAWIVAIPIAILLAVYVIVDPFKVIWEYEEYYPAPPSFQPWVNQATVTNRTWRRQRHTHHYNAYILGASQAENMPVDAWLKHLPDDAVPYNFHTSWEGLAATAETLEMLDREGADLKYALVVLSPMVFFKEYTYSPAEINIPYVQTSLSWPRYHWEFVKGFYHRDFIRSYIASYAKHWSFDVNGTNAVTYNDAFVDPVTNEMRHYESDRRIREDAAEYAYTHFWETQPPKGTLSLHSRGLGPRREAMLRRMADIFAKHHTDYRVVLVPSRMRDVPHPADNALLRDVFGDRYRDMTRAYPWTWEVDTLWYDNIHFRPQVGKMLIDSVYFL